jgi:hypothetical protein
VVRIERDGSAYLARWTLSFTRTRLVLAALAALSVLWITAGIPYQGTRHGAAMPMQWLLAPLILAPSMFAGLFAASKAGAAERVAKLLRRALAPEAAANGTSLPR